MGTESWDHLCYDTVDWETVSEDSTRLCRTKQGSWSIVLPIMFGVASNLLYRVLEPWIERQFERLQNVPEQERRQYEQNVSEVIPIFGEADIFVGQRRPWAREKLNDFGEELGEELAQETSLNESRIGTFRQSISQLEGSKQRLDELGLSDLQEIAEEDASVYEVLDNVGSLSANEFFQTLDLAVSANLAMEQERPKDILLAEDTSVDFSSDVVSIGGPIANLYTRNVMYGDDVSLPYRFDLNPVGVDDDLREYTPQELRRISLADDRELGHRPNWRIVDRDGEPLEILGDATVPNWRDGQWVTDYFTVAKLPNPHPSAPPLRRAETRRTLLLAGCHGFGTRAALEALKSGDVLETIESQAADGYFQLVGRVRRAEGARITADNIEIPEAHLRQIHVD